MDIKEFIEKNAENMKADLKQLVSFNSVYSDDEAPFGSQNRKVLEKALQLMEEKGLRTENVDYYAGYGETGAGDRLIGILAHLDVVPCGDGWDSDPFDMIEKDGYLYGRGVADDKGAAVASMYALKYLIDEGYPFHKRVRLILGCNEETGSECIRHYVSRHGQIDCGFTPDGGFPGIYAEKGMVGAKVVCHDSRIIDARGGEAGNIVNKRVDLTVPADSFDEDRFREYLDSRGIGYELEKKDDVHIVVFGKAAHASTPDEGVNAISHALEALYHAGFQDSLCNWFHDHFALTLHGELLGYEALKDEITDTSINFGVIGKQGNDIVISLDMRFPVKADIEKVKSLLEVGDGHCEIVVVRDHKPLYFDQDSKMIRALRKAYVDVTGDDKTPMEAIGGGTYAKAIDNCIAFGSEFPGADSNIHGANERLNIGSFLKQVEIYVEAIKNLDEIED